MKIQAVVFLCFQLWSSLFNSLRAQDASTIIKTSEDKMRGKTLQGEMVIKTVRPSWSREMEMKVWMKGTEYSLIYIVTPQKDKGTTFRTFHQITTINDVAKLDGD